MPLCLAAKDIPAQACSDCELRSDMVSVFNEGRIVRARLGGKQILTEVRITIGFSTRHRSLSHEE